MIEDRVVGIASREIYETPGLSLLIKAHKELESITLNPDVVDFKGIVEKMGSISLSRFLVWSSKGELHLYFIYQASVNGR